MQAGICPAVGIVKITRENSNKALKTPENPSKLKDEQ
jgi:hypothetical protein